MQASAAASEVEAQPDAELLPLVVLAVEAAADDVLRCRIVIGLGIRQLLEEGRGDPPIPAAVVHRGAEEIRGIHPLGGAEAAAVVAAVVAVLGAGVPARRELIREAGREFELAFVLPFAVEALF